MLSVIRTASPDDLPTLQQHDRHISPRELEHSVRLGRVYVAEAQSVFIGWLRWTLFGRSLVEHWEDQMKQAGYETVMTSTQSDEYAQHFYRRLGYAAVGGFLPPGEAYELMLAKKL